MLNADQITEKGLLKLEQSKGKKAQVGYDLSLKEAALKLNFISSEAFDKAMDLKKMVRPYVAK